MKRYLVIDTECVGAVQAPTIYNIGYIVVNKQGNVLKQKHYLVQETYKAYKGKKQPLYADMVANGEIEIKPFAEIWLALQADLMAVDMVCAYNANYDISAIKSTVKQLLGLTVEISGSICDLWTLVTEKLINTSKFKKWCLSNSYYKKYFFSSVEVVSRYLFDTDYSEKHIAFEDVLDEWRIMQVAIRRHITIKPQLCKFPFAKLGTVKKFVGA